VCTALQNYNGAVELLNQPLFHKMPLCGPRGSNQDMQGPVTLIAMQGVPHNLISGQGKICVNTRSHAMCNAGQRDHVQSNLTVNRKSSNKPGNSFIRKNSDMLHVKLLLKINGPIYLLLGKTHHTFTENILRKLVTLVSCAFPWDQT